jgi:hypothetical protein
VHNWHVDWQSGHVYFAQWWSGTPPEDCKLTKKRQRRQYETIMYIVCALKRTIKMITYMQSQHAYHHLDFGIQSLHHISVTNQLRHTKSNPLQ